MRVGIVINPMSGRDVRRLAARATTVSHLQKQNEVARLVLGALNFGAECVYMNDEPFRIGSRAVENLNLRKRVQLIRPAKLHHNDLDTHSAVQSMQHHGCKVLIVVGGDGTHRIVARSWPAVPMITMSTGTNNVFPTFVEASVAGSAAGLVASGQVRLEDVSHQAKRVVVRTDTCEEDMALVDAVLMRNDTVGNFLPFRADKISHILLARSEPAAVGVSPIGGSLIPSGFDDDFGVEVICGGPDPAMRVKVAISPGLYEHVSIKRISKVALNHVSKCQGPGVLAFDGDRCLKLADGENAELQVRRDGPLVIDVNQTLLAAAKQQILSE